MNYKKRKLIYLLGLTSMLSLTGCDIDLAKTKIMNKCLESHMDIDSLKFETLSDGREHVKDATVFYSLRERFLNNNSIINFDNVEFDDENFELLKNASNYLYLFDNEVIKNHINYYMTQLSLEEIQKNYQEGENYVQMNLWYDLGNEKTYIISIISKPADYENIREEYRTKGIGYTKKIDPFKIGNDKYHVDEKYSLSSTEKNDLNKIQITIQTSYNLYKDIIIEKNYVCEDNENIITLNNGEESIEANLTEEQFNELATLLTEAAKKETTVKEFLETNEELMIELYGEDYQKFIEVAKTAEYIKK